MCGCACELSGVKQINFLYNTNFGFNFVYLLFAFIKFFAFFFLVLILFVTNKKHQKRRTGKLNLKLCLLVFFLFLG